MGYGQVTDLESKASGVGSIFFPIGCGAEYDLLKMTVAGPEEGAYMDPGTEYLRQLDPESTATIKKYTYVSKEWIIDNIADEDTWEEFAGAIGWWNYDKEWSIEDLVNEKDYEHKVKETSLPITMGAAFLGNFDRNGIRFISNGEVMNGTSEFRDGGKKAPLFMNYLPITIDLNDLAVYGDDEDLDYMDPGTEYLRQLDPESTATVNKYTYVSKAWIIDNIADEDTWEEYAGAIGWWNYSSEYSIEDLVNEKDYEHKIKTAVPLAPGTHFLGNFDRNDVRIRFPNALNMPTK